MFNNEILLECFIITHIIYIYNLKQTFNKNKEHIDQIVFFFVVTCLIYYNAFNKVSYTK